MDSCWGRESRDFLEVSYLRHHPPKDLLTNELDVITSVERVRKRNDSED